MSATDDLDEIFSSLLDGDPATAPPVAATTPPVAATTTPPVAAATTPPVAATTLPNLDTQKTFIINNADLLDVKIKTTIITLVMMEVGESALLNTHSPNAKETNINLDVIGETNPEVLTNIYNMVRARRDALSQPARTVDRTSAK